MLVVLAVAVAAAGLAGVPAAHADHVEGDRLAGGNRFETAAAVAEELAPDGTDRVFLARGDRFPDAVAASFAVGHTQDPVLLTAPERVPEATLHALDELDAREVTLLGGRQAIGSRVAERLRRVGHRVDRVDGSTRYEISAAVAQRFADEGIGSVDGRRTALLASGESFEDGLLVSPLAAGGHFPLLLTERTRYPREVAEALADLDVEQVFIVGDTTAVSHDVHQALEEDGYVVDRLGDRDDHGTAAIVAQFAIYHLRWSLNEVFFVDARGFASAVTAGGLAGLSEGVLVLTNPPASDFTEAWLEELCPRIGRVRAIGGPEAVPVQWHDTALQAADACSHAAATQSAAGVTPTPSPDGGHPSEDVNDSHRDEDPDQAGVTDRDRASGREEHADLDGDPWWRPLFRWLP